jgi:hypothetical protein
MHKAYLLLLLAPSALVYACGGSDNSTLDGGGDATVDSPGNDSSKNDSGGQDSSNDTSPMNDGGQDATQDVSVSIACTEPAQCIDGGNLDAAYPPSSGEVCCAQVTTTGAFPNCKPSSVSTACSAPGSCASSYSTSSCSTDTFRACAHNAECTETQFNKCCTAKVGDGGATFCMDAILISALKATCM